MTPPFSSFSGSPQPTTGLALLVTMLNNTRAANCSRCPTVTYSKQPANLSLSLFTLFIIAIVNKPKSISNTTASIQHHIATSIPPSILSRSPLKPASYRREFWSVNLLAICVYRDCEEDDATQVKWKSHLKFQKWSLIY